MRSNNLTKQQVTETRGMLFQALTLSWEVKIKILNPSAGVTNAITAYSGPSRCELDYTRDQLGNVRVTMRKPSISVSYSPTMKEHIWMIIDAAMMPGNSYECRQGVDRSNLRIVPSVPVKAPPVTPLFGRPVYELPSWEDARSRFGQAAYLQDGPREPINVTSFADNIKKIEFTPQPEVVSADEIAETKSIINDIIGRNERGYSAIALAKAYGIKPEDIMRVFNQESAQTEPVKKAKPVAPDPMLENRRRIRAD